MGVATGSLSAQNQEISNMSSITPEGMKEETFCTSLLLVEYYKYLGEGDLGLDLPGKALTLVRLIAEYQVAKKEHESRLREKEERYGQH